MRKIIVLFIFLILIIIPTYADSIESFVEGYAIFEDDGQYGVVNTKGEITVEPEWDKMIRLTAELVAVSKDSQAGMVNVTTGEIVIEPRWKTFKNFVGKNWIGVLTHDNHFYVCDITTDQLVPSSVSHIVSYYEPAYDIAHALMDDGRRLYTLSLNDFLIIDETYILKSFVNNVGIIYGNDHYGLVDIDGHITASVQWDNIHHFHSEVAIAQKNDQTYVINRYGKVLLTSEWDYISNFYEDRAIVSKDGLYGLIDKDGNYIIPLKWDEIQRDYEDYSTPCIVRKGNQYGYIDIDSGKVLASNFTYAWHHNSGIALAKKGNRQILLNLDGQEIFKPPYPTNGYEQGMAALFKEEGDLIYVGFMNTSGEVVEKPEWDGTLHYHEGLAAVKDGEVWGYVPWDTWQAENPGSIPSGAMPGQPVWELQKRENGDL